MEPLRETRRRSAALFGNEKTVEVILALKGEGIATAQMVAAKTGLAHSLARDALKRLCQGGVIREIPRVGGSRSSLYYEPIEGPLWEALAAAAREVSALSCEVASQSSSQSNSQPD
jgi:ribosomal protein S25